MLPQLLCILILFAAPASEEKASKMHGEPRHRRVSTRLNRSA